MDGSKRIRWSNRPDYADNDGGFITKGDNNDQTDQEGGHYPPIRREWIAGVVPTIGSLPLKIPLVGYIPLLIEENMKNPRLLPLLLGVLALALLLDEAKRRRKKEVLQRGQLYLLGGETAKVTATVNAREEGIFNASIIVGMFMPFLPPAIIGFLASINFWLAIIVVSVVPALPLMILPYLEPRYRRRFLREIRRKWARTIGWLHL
ncbi:MAG TPA: hypothetical protein GX716_04620 [Firmicutes bacterium]|nr:hypothetical protein [Candidatus Fermentithermobacillaceae bacterium]